MRERNSLKLRVLEALDRRGWTNPPLAAVLVGFSPVRAIYAHLKRYERWGLLERARDARGLLLYRVTDRGRNRLAWLRKRVP